jgi:hypothetical protein
MTKKPRDRRVETARAFGLWRSASSKREGDRHLVRLWELCRPEIARAVQDVAGGQRSVRAWLDRRGLTFEEIANAVFPAVEDAASRYDPGHESGASFPTFAMKHIKGEVVRIALDSPPLAGPEGPEDRPQEEPNPEEEPLDFTDLVELVRKHRRSKIVEDVYQAAKYPEEYSSEDLRWFADLLEEKYAKELEWDTKLKALHSSLVVMSVRAEDYEGKMVNIGTLWHLLLIREYCRAQGMSTESYSPSVLSRIFGKPSDKTLAKWLKACDEQGITAQNWTPEQLARIITSRRGPKFRGRRELPNSRPDQPDLLS